MGFIVIILQSKTNEHYEDLVNHFATQLLKMRIRLPYNLSLKTNADGVFTVESPFHLWPVCMQITELISDKRILLKCKISTNLLSAKIELFMSAFASTIALSLNQFESKDYEFHLPDGISIALRLLH